MTFKTIVVSNAAYLNVKQKQLQISIAGTCSSVPLEDVACIILDHWQITLSLTMLSACSKNNVVVISCDDKHLPSGIFHSYLPHSRQTLVLNKQLALSQPFKNRLWQKIIQQKIFNQAQTIARIASQNNTYKKLILLSQSVASGDKDNVEAVASKIYFTDIFGSSFYRVKKFTPLQDKNDDDPAINTYLNYAYSIVRGLICRSIVGYGLLPVLGIFHNNQLNAFNLADDFIEPYRAFIDWYVYDLVLDNCGLEFTPKIKVLLVDVLNYIIVIDGKSTTVLNSVDVMIKSYITCINNNSYDYIKLPSLPNKIKRSNIE